MTHDEPTTQTLTDSSTAAPAAADVEEGAVVEADVLVEDVSIDGMCGVY
jgi:mycofactocin precursor